MVMATVRILYYPTFAAIHFFIRNPNSAFIIKPTMSAVTILVWYLLILPFLFLWWPIACIRWRRRTRVNSFR